MSIVVYREPKYKLHASLFFGNHLYYFLMIIILNFCLFVSYSYYIFTYSISIPIGSSPSTRDITNLTSETLKQLDKQTHAEDR